ncbi:MAG: hypothetical protein ACYC2P_00610 [Paludibacteraceae bacterium]
MRKILLFAALIIISAAQFVNAQVNGTAAKPLVSTTDKPVYYYIESAADGTVKMGSNAGKNYLGNLLYESTATGSSGSPSSVTAWMLKHDLMATITGAGYSIDNALWQIVDEGGVVKLKNKGTGHFMIESRWAYTSTTAQFITTSLNTPATQYCFRNSTQTSFGVAWNNAANGNYIDRWSYTGANSQIAWFFLVAPGSETNYQDLYVSAVKSDLAAKITAMQTVLDNTSEGTDPGKFTADARTAFANAKSAAQTIYDNASSTVENYLTTITNLETAKWTFLSSAIKPIISDATTTRWYFLQGLRPANSYMTSTGSKAQILGKTVIPDDTQLWKFVANTRGTANGFAIVNKATGEYLSANTPFNTAISSTDTIPTNNLQFIASDIFTNNTTRFWIENAAGSTPAFRLHAGNSSILNWNGNAYDNSSWLVLDYINTLKVLLQTSLTNAQNLLAASVEGSDVGQYPAANRADLQTAITNAQGIYDAPASTDAQIKDAAVALNAVIDAYKASRILPVAYSGTINTGYLYTLKLVQPGSGNDGYYLSNPRTDANNGLDANRPYATFSSLIDPATTVWQFAASTTTGKYILVSSRRANEYLDEEGRVRDASSYADNSWTTKTLMQSTLTYTEGTTLLIVNIDANSNYYTVGIASGATLGRNATNWSTFLLQQYIPTGNINTKGGSAKAYAVNGSIKVTDTDNFSVFTITGAKVQNKNLKPGIYFAKTATQTFKVFVK